MCMLVQELLNYKYPAPEHGYGTVQVSSESESVHDLGVGERHLAMSILIQTENFCDNLN